MWSSKKKECIIIEIIHFFFLYSIDLDWRAVPTRLVTGAFDWVEDGPSVSGNDSPPTDTEQK